jgi:MFS family permease
MITSADAAAAEVREVPGPRPVPLWRNVQFQLLWAGQAASSLGIGVADVAYPLAILALTGSPAHAGLFAAVQTTGILLGALPGGQLADRCDRRTIVIGAESVRAAVTLVVALGLMFSWLTLPVLFGSGAVLGLAQATSGAARLPLLRSVVPDNQLTAALAQDEVRQNGAALAGPPLAGALYAVRALQHAAPFIFTAVSFGLSVAAALAMKLLPASAVYGSDNDGSAEQRTRGDSGMLIGIRTLWASPLLRTAMLLIMIVNMVGVGLDLIIIVVLRDQHVRPGLIGVALAGAAVGGLAGAPLVKPLHRIRPGVLLLTACLLEIPFVLGLAVPLGAWWVATILFLSSLAVPALRALVDVLIFRQTPDAERGRVAAAVMTLISLGMPAGMAGAGFLLQWLSPEKAMVLLASFLAVGVLYCASKRELWRAQWPH